MFDDQMYTRLLAIIGLAIKQTVATSDNCEAEFGHVLHVLCTVLEVLPMLCPAEHLSSMWLILLREPLQYLPGPDSPPQSEEEEAGKASISDHIPGVEEASLQLIRNLDYTLINKKLEFMYYFRRCSRENEIHFVMSMTTRRDNLDGSLWRLAVEGFNRILVDDIGKVAVECGPDSKISKPARLHIWNVYEIFLVGYCGRPLPSNSLSAATLKDDKSLEMTIVNILGQEILKTPVDTLIEILQ